MHYLGGIKKIWLATYFYLPTEPLRKLTAEEDLEEICKDQVQNEVEKITALYSVFHSVFVNVLWK